MLLHSKFIDKASNIKNAKLLQLNLLEVNRFKAVPPAFQQVENNLFDDNPFEVDTFDVDPLQLTNLKLIYSESTNLKFIDSK